MRVPLIYKPQPVFGLDIGSRTVKLVQMAPSNHVLGFGYAAFPPDSITEGIIADPEPIAEAIKAVIKSPKGGRITARRINMSVPVSKVFTRTIQLPAQLSAAELEQAVRLEAEQYVPVPLPDLYIDYEIIPAAADGKKDFVEVLMVAAPRAIIDSYIKLFDFVDFELEAVETGLTSITRALIAADQPEGRVLVVDFGTKSTDLAIYDQAVRLTGTFAVGGEGLTQTLVKQLGVSAEQANEIKYRFGIKQSGLQSKILDALKPQLETLTLEIKKILKYYQDRSQDSSKIERMIMTGGSASMPGLVDYLYHAMGVPIIIGDPWMQLKARLAPEKLEASMYTTSIGLALRGLKND
jgi:type IV pilus assembly protein PilM